MKRLGNAVSLMLHPVVFVLWLAERLLDLMDARWLKPSCAARAGGLVSTSQSVGQRQDAECVAA